MVLVLPIGWLFAQAGSSLEMTQLSQKISVPRRTQIYEGVSVVSCDALALIVVRPSPKMLLLSVGRGEDEQQKGRWLNQTLCLSIPWHNNFMGGASHMMIFVSKVLLGF